MATATVIKARPIPVPVEKIVLELSVGEAQYVAAVLAKGNEAKFLYDHELPKNYRSVYSTLTQALRESGVRTDAYTTRIEGWFYSRVKAGLL